MALHPSCRKPPRAPADKRTFCTVREAAHICECTQGDIQRLHDNGKLYIERGPIDTYVKLADLVALLHRERFNVDLAIEVLEEMDDTLTRFLDLPTVGLQNVDVRKLAILRSSVRKLLGKG